MNKETYRIAIAIEELIEINGETGRALEELQYANKKGLLDENKEEILEMIKTVRLKSQSLIDLLDDGDRDD